VTKYSTAEETRELKNP